MKHVCILFDRLLNFRLRRRLFSDYGVPDSNRDYAERELLVRPQENGDKIGRQLKINKPTKSNKNVRTPIRVPGTTVCKIEFSAVASERQQINFNVTGDGVPILQDKIGLPLSYIQELTSSDTPGLSTQS